MLVFIVLEVLGFGSFELCQLLTSGGVVMERGWWESVVQWVLGAIPWHFCLGCSKSKRIAWADGRYTPGYFPGKCAFVPLLLHRFPGWG